MDKGKPVRLEEFEGIGYHKLFNEINKDKCPYEELCIIKKFGRINCITGYEDCQTYKYYKKYMK